MEDNKLKAKINEAVRDGLIHQEDRHQLLRNTKKLAEVMKERNITLVSKDCTVQFIAACQFILVVSKYTFRAAFADSKFNTEKEFLEKCWYKEVMIRIDNDMLKLRLCDLYEACSSTTFLDSKSNTCANSFLQNDFTRNDFDLLVAVLEDNNLDYKCCTNSGTEAEIQSIFNSIITADALRDSLNSCKTNPSQAEKVLSEVYNVLNTCVFKGISNCTIKLPHSESHNVNAILNLLESKEFAATYEIADGFVYLVVKALPSGGDYNADYTEKQLSTMLTSGLGSAYFFVATYCANVVIPKILNNAVTSIVERLNKVTAADKNFKISMVETKTDSYTQLFDVLKSKGFHVTVNDSVFEVGW